MEDDDETEMLPVSGIPREPVREYFDPVLNAWVRVFEPGWAEGSVTGVTAKSKHNGRRGSGT